MHFFNMTNQVNHVEAPRMASKNLKQWLDEYGATHQHPANKKIHFICVPIILFATLGLLWDIPVPQVLADTLINWGWLLIAVFLLFYLRLSLALTAGMALVLVAMGLLCEGYLTYGPTSLWSLSLTAFILAWIGQFYGHHLEGKKPSFFKDILFLLIGPLWILSFVYQRLSIPFDSKPH